MHVTAQPPEPRPDNVRQPRLRQVRKQRQRQISDGQTIETARPVAGEEELLLTQKVLKRLQESPRQSVQPDIVPVLRFRQKRGDGLCGPTEERSRDVFGARCVVRAVFRGGIGRVEVEGGEAEVLGACPRGCSTVWRRNPLAWPGEEGSVGGAGGGCVVLAGDVEGEVE